jgi:hypothetical protein
MKMLLRLTAAVVLAAGCLTYGSLQAGDKKEEKKDGKKEEKKGPAKDVVVEGELTNADLKDKVRTEMYCKTYTYKMTEGRTYQIDLKGANGLDTYLRLENPAGDQVAEDDDGGGFPDARIVYKAPKSGEFTIICTTFAGGATGKFTLTVKDLDGKQPDPVPQNKGGALPPPPPPAKGAIAPAVNIDVRAALLRAAIDERR